MYSRKDLRITVYYPESDLISVKNFFANENVSWIRVDSHSWQTEGLSRLSMGGRIEVNATFVNNNPDSFLQDRAHVQSLQLMSKPAKNTDVAPHLLLDSLLIPV